jgi:ketosteroid isomerase-like protein
VSRPSTTAIATLDSFLTGLKWHNWEQLAPFFAQNAQFIDPTAKCWKGREEIEKQFEVLFAPYAKKNITFLVENTDVGPAESLVAGILWENVTIGTDPTRSIHRMTVILAPEGEDWAIFFVQITPVLGR